MNLNTKCYTGTIPVSNDFLRALYMWNRSSRIIFIVYSFMVLNATFNNISVISWQSVLLVEEIGVSRETNDLSEVNDKLLSHNVVSSTPCLSGVRTLNVRAIGTDFIGSNKSNYHTITTTTVSCYFYIFLARFSCVKIDGA